LETNGTMDVTPVPPEVVRIMDVKCPGSGESGKTLLGNLSVLTRRDEVKFVISDRPDFDWAASFIERQKLLGGPHLLFAPAYGRLAAAELAAWILESRLEVRLQLQLHKILWPDRSRGV
jgi:7-carboxy-7-deazaguanine synthase